MEFNVGDSVEAIDQLGIWTKAKVVSKADSSVVVNFPPWRAEWDREINNPSEIRQVTAEETLIPRRFANNKVRIRSNHCLFLALFYFFCVKSNLFILLCLQFPNLKKLFQGDVVYINGKEVNVLRSDPIRKSVSIDYL